MVEVIGIILKNPRFLSKKCLTIILTNLYFRNSWKIIFKPNHFFRAFLFSRSFKNVSKNPQSWKNIFKKFSKSFPGTFRKIIKKYISPALSLENYYIKKSLFIFGKAHKNIYKLHDSGPWSPYNYY